MGSTSKRWGILPPVRRFAFLWLTAAAAGPAAGAVLSSGQEVELKVKIDPGAGNRIFGPWMVTLRKSSGEYVRVTSARGGGRVRFKHLRPDIYVACLVGSGISARCQSIDMVPPPDGENHEFTMSLQAPDPVLNRSSLHTVKLSQLEVPLKAQQEVMLAVQAELRDDGQDMLNHLKQALEIDPSYIEALNNLGVYYRRSGDAQLSVQYLTKVTQLDPECYAGWVNLAGELLSTYRWEEALKAALRGVPLEPDDPRAYSLAALSYYYMRRYSEAEPYFKKVLDLDPSFANSPALYLARISLVAYRKNDAEDYIRVFLKFHPNSTDAPFWRNTLNGLVTGATIVPPVVTVEQRQK